MKKNMIGTLAARNRAASKMRDRFILTAIVLTAFMITSVLSIAIGMVETVEAQGIRLRGTVADLEFSSPTAEQLERLSELDYVENFGLRHRMAVVESVVIVSEERLYLSHFDKASLGFAMPAWINIQGEYPRSEGEVMASRRILQQLGIEEPKLGMSLVIAFTPMNGGEAREKAFILSGIYTDFNRSGDSQLLISEELFVHMGGETPFEPEQVSVDVLFTVNSPLLQTVGLLERNLSMTLEQMEALQITAGNPDGSGHFVTLLIATLFVIFLMFTGFLLIYSILYASVARDVRFYGLLRTVGATAGQIRQVVLLQIMRLCLIGIPVGLLLGFGTSFLLVPMLVSATTGAVISFSPLIYAGASLFTLLTTLFGSSLPTRKISGLSLIEASKHVGEARIHNPNRGRTKGRLWMLALRNILRDRKRMIAVLLSLFFSLVAFMATSTLVSSMDPTRYMELFAENLGEGDFIIQPAQLGRPLLNGKLFEQVNSLSGIDELQIIAVERDVYIKFQPAFERQIDGFVDWLREFGVNASRGQFMEGGNGDMFGITGDELGKLDAEWDAGAFERGEFAIAIADFTEDMKDVEKIEGFFHDESSPGGIGEPFSIPIGGSVANQEFRWTKWANTPVPSLLVSQTFLERFREDPVIIDIQITGSSGEQEELSEALRSIVESTGDVILFSQYEGRAGLEQARGLIFMLGTSLALILGAMGILNFINTISMSILARKLEFATLESIGMMKGQLRKMLIYEGLWYAGVALALALTLGTVICVGLYLASRHVFTVTIGNFLKFTYPLVPMLMLALVLFGICFVIPCLLFAFQNKSTIVEKLRDIE